MFNGAHKQVRPHEIVVNMFIVVGQQACQRQSVTGCLTRTGQAAHKQMEPRQTYVARQA